jgi:hypothetical protein
MPTTRDAHKAGRTDVEVRLMWTVALDDPTAMGNGGLEGADDVSWSTVRPNVGLGKHAARKYVVDHLLNDPKVGGISVQLIKREWVADSYEDDAYGLIRDAFTRELYCTDGYWDTGDATFIYDERYRR